ncbi:uncharacterized protein LY89DRAFT_742626 [Mollisia scopiformis]|uniref:Uncharacterized protein n=1 Tax=Mollisia scopiformis TaxID=149040 RepID=A0A132B633_MOLSC|nr:uncharacterized protein LY89DRAFT_742626 [Mollisia scopiformis]KUJ07860.1 hypothetical protein LY89DRAFT_742626 [Mollisia scopiformis]
MRLTILVTALFLALAHAIPVDDTADVALTAAMQSTIDLANAVLQQAGVEQTERACDINFRKCYMRCTGAPTCYAVCFLKYCN